MAFRKETIKTGKNKSVRPLIIKPEMSPTSTDLNVAVTK
jgi:hypothetical protein